jgi:hypothetical protein
MWRPTALATSGNSSTPSSPAWRRPALLQQLQEPYWLPCPRLLCILHDDSEPPPAV